MGSATVRVSKAAVPKGLPTYLQFGTDRRRAGYRLVRGVVNAPEVQARWRAARHLTPAADLKVPRETGFMKLPAFRFPEVAEVVDAALRIGDGFTPPPLDAGAGKQQLFENLLDQGSLDLDSPYIRLALRDDVLTMVSSYLGVVPVLSLIDVWYSRWTPTYSNSQLLHCDWADTQQMKLFVFCTDVSEQNGPLTLIDATSSARLRGHLGYRYAGKRYRVPDGAAEELLGPEPATQLTGPSGTTALADTSRCFHQGSRIAEPGLHRIVVMIQYLTPTAFCFPLRRGATTQYSHLTAATLSTSALSPLAQMALGRAGS